MEGSSSVLLSILPKTQPNSMSQLLLFFPSAQQECKAKGERVSLYAVDMYCNMDRQITAYPVMIRAAQYQSVVVPVLLKGKAGISAKTLIS